MSACAIGRPRRTLAALVTVTVAALVFAVLLVLVRLQWPPLESVDHGAAARINRLIAGEHALVTVVNAGCSRTEMICSGRSAGPG